MHNGVSRYLWRERSRWSAGTKICLHFNVFISSFFWFICQNMKLNTDNWLNLEAIPALKEGIFEFCLTFLANFSTKKGGDWACLDDSFAIYRQNINRFLQTPVNILIYISLTASFRSFGIINNKFFYSVCVFFSQWPHHHHGSGFPSG